MSVPINRCGGFYDKPTNGAVVMTLDDRNKKANEELQARYEKLNQFYEGAEQIFKDMKLALEASHTYWIDYDDESRNDPEEEGTAFCIGFVKYDGTWQLCHGIYRTHVSYDRETTWKPIREASIEQRVAAAPHLEKLREALVTAKEKFVPKVDKAIEAIQEFIERDLGLVQ